MYAEDRDTWVKAYFMFLNACKRDFEDTLFLFQQFSQLCPDKYNEDKVVNFHYENHKYYGTKENEITLGTLCYWVKEASPDIYKAWFKQVKTKEDEDYCGVIFDDYKQVKKEFEEKYCFLHNHSMYAVL